jgi:hypothetical protein
MRTITIVVLVLGLLVRPAIADDGDRWEASTMALQATGGLAGGILGGAGLGFAGFLIGSTVANRGDWGVPLAFGAAGVTVGGMIGITVGVQLVGDSAGATGVWWATGLGTLGGVVVTGALAAKLPLKNLPKPMVVTAGLLLLLVPPVIAYQASSDGREPIAMPVAFSF